MSIDNYENFTFEGYTEGEEGNPTLYFKEGRYTQKHNDPKNVGWHPRAKHYRGHNITKEAWELYNKIRGKDDNTDKNAFKKEFLKGTYDSSADNAMFFECSSIDGISCQAHPSRSRFIVAGSKGSNPDYNKAYAKSILKDGKIADNEK